MMIKAVIFDFYGVLEKHGEPNQELLSYIRQSLKPRYKLGIISNAAGDSIPRILPPEDVELFDDTILSYRAGASKPEAEIYELSLANLGVKAPEAVFIDDIEEFCTAATATGMKAVHYKDFERMKKELEKLLTVPNN